MTICPLVAAESERTLRPVPPGSRLTCAVRSRPVVLGSTLSVRRSPLPSGAAGTHQWALLTAVHVPATSTATSASPPSTATGGSAVPPGGAGGVVVVSSSEQALSASTTQAVKAHKFLLFFMASEVRKVVSHRLI